MSAPLIHVGYHKTATTWLQHVYFKHHPELQLCGEFDEIHPLLIAPDDLDFDVHAVIEFFRPRIEASAAAGRLAVLSSERLSGNPHSGGYDAGTIAARLHACFPQARILLVVREQRAALLANYKQYVRMGGICRLEEYLQPPADGRIPLFRLRNFEYDRLARRYAQLFGATRLLVLPYELMLHSPEAFCDRIARFAGIGAAAGLPYGLRVNPSPSDAATLLKRRANRWHGGDSLFPVRPPCPWLTTRLFEAIARLDRTRLRRWRCRRWRDSIGRICAGRFEESNRRLQALTAEELGRFGYAL